MLGNVLGTRYSAMNETDIAPALIDLWSIEEDKHESTNYNEM